MGFAFECTNHKSTYFMLRNASLGVSKMIIFLGGIEHEVEVVDNANREREKTCGDGNLKTWKWQR